MKGFKKFLLIYVICFIVIGAAFLVGFHGFIAAYEKSQPVPYVKEYMAAGMPSALEDEISKLDADLTSAEDAKTYLAELFDSARLYKVTGTEYSIRVDDKELGKVMIEKTEGKFGFNEWKIAAEEFNISPWLTYTEVSVPSDYDVCINGNSLGSGYITSNETPYVAFESAYEDFPDLPRLVSYKSGAHFDSAVLELKAPDGTVLSEADEHAFLSNCDEETLARLQKFADEYALKYMALVANIDNGAWMNYRNIYPLMREDSPLDDLIHQALNIIACSPTSAFELKGVDLITCSDLGDGRYYIDCCYKADLTINKVDTYQENYIRLLLWTNEKGRLQAEAMYNYTV